MTAFLSTHRQRSQSLPFVVRLLCGSGWCFPQHCCPSYSRTCYSNSYGCYLYYAPAYSCWTWYCPEDCCYYQVEPE